MKVSGYSGALRQLQHPRAMLFMLTLAPLMVVLLPRRRLEVTWLGWT